MQCQYEFCLRPCRGQAEMAMDRRSLAQGGIERSFAVEPMGAKRTGYALGVPHKLLFQAGWALEREATQKRDLPLLPGFK